MFSHCYTNCVVINLYIFKQLSYSFQYTFINELVQKEKKTNVKNMYQAQSDVTMNFKTFCPTISIFIPIKIWVIRTTAMLFCIHFSFVSFYLALRNGQSQILMGKKSILPSAVTSWKTFTWYNSCECAGCVTTTLSSETMWLNDSRFSHFTSFQQAENLKGNSDVFQANIHCFLQ